MSKRGQFRVCPICGSHLDAGEICDCRQEKEAVPMQRERPQAKLPTASLPGRVLEVKSMGRRERVCV